MNYVYNKENQYTATGDFIPKGKPNNEPRYVAEEHGSTSEGRSYCPIGSGGYVAETDNAFYKINKLGANYPYADHDSYTAYTESNYQTDYVSNYALDATGFNHGTIREKRKCPTAADLKRYKDDFLLLNNLQGTKHYYNINKN